MGEGLSEADCGLRVLEYGGVAVWLTVSEGEGEALAVGSELFEREGGDGVLLSEGVAVAVVLKVREPCGVEVAVALRVVVGERETDTETVGDE